MNSAVVRRIGLAFGAALAFGVVMSVVKGNGAGLRSDIGNLSAPWLLVPFLAAGYASGGRLGRGVVIGTATSMLALVGFYVANSVVLDLGPHPWTTDLRLAVTSGQRWYALGLISGPVFGLIGALWRRTESRLIGVAVFGSLIAESVVLWTLQNRSVGFFAISPANQLVYVGEALVGATVCAVAIARRPARVAECVKPSP